MTSMTTSGIVNGEDVIKVNRLNQYVGAFVASLGGFALGVSLGWNSSASEVLRNVLNAPIAQIGLIGSILNVGAFIGILLLPFLLTFLSRIAVMFLTMPVSLVGWACICFANQKVSILIAGRFICGFCGGMFCVLTPIYIGEIADKETRGRLLMFFQLLINCGIMYAYVTAHAMDERETVWRYSLVCAISCLPIGTVNLLPESPLYHLRRNDEINAKNSLRWYRGEAYNIEQELEDFRRLAAGSERKITLKAITRRKVLRSFGTCFSAILAQQLSGIGTMTFHALALFNIAGSRDLTGSEQTIVAAASQILSCCLATILIDVLGRRALLTASSGLMGLFLVLLGCFFKTVDREPAYGDTYHWIPPTWITLFFFSFNVGVGPISWAILGDIYPTEIKLPAAVLTATISWMLSLVATTTFLDTLMKFGVPKTLWLYSGFCWLASVLCLLVARDTGGKSLIEIQEDLENSSRSPESRGEGG